MGGSVTEPQSPETPDRTDDEMPKLTAEEWAYIQAVVDAEKAKGDD